MKQILTILSFFLLLSIEAFAQQKSQITVHGTVTDEKNMPLIGASVVVKNVAGLGVATDTKGKFTIKMESYNRLIISYLGYESQEILIKEQTSISVVLKENKSTVVDEVVVTGTGAQKKITVTGAVSTVNIESLKTTPGGNLPNALAGRVAGIIARQSNGQPGNNYSEFWIRGISTFGASSSALILVDGFERDMNQLNIEDIESFSVLKDASETAIYGSRGANGVVLITTRHGHVSKSKIDAKFEAMYNTRTVTPDFVDGYSYAKLANEARRTRNLEPIFANDELKIMKMGLDPELLPNVNWKDVLLKNGARSYRTTLNINGGGQYARYYVSSSYIDEDGMYKVDKSIRKNYNTNTHNQRINYRMNVDVDVTKTTLLQIGIGGSLQKLNESSMSSSDIWNSIIGQTPVSIPLRYENGYVPASSSGKINPWVASTQCGYVEQWWNKIQTNLTLTQKFDFITKGLIFYARIGYDTDNFNWIKRYKMPELWKAERFRDENGDVIYKRIAAQQEMTQSSGSSGDRNEYCETELSYNRSFNSHNVSATLKYTQDSKVQTQNIGSDIKNSLPVRHQGIAGRIAYNWKYRYFINFNFGYTGSENFAKGSQFGFFPAYSVAWNIAEEPWIKNNLKWMTMFKVRYSWGKVGNDQVYSNGSLIRFPYLYTIGATGTPPYQTVGDWTGQYALYGGYNWGDYGFTNAFAGMQYTAYANRKVTWEVSTKHDVGMDLSILNNKFSLTVDYFHELRNGIYMYRNYLPATAGVNNNLTKPQANIGSVLSRGMDGNFSFQNNIGPVTLTLRGNMTVSTNTVEEKDEEYNVYPYLKEKGYRVNQATGLIAMGLFKTYDEIRTSPKQMFGDVQPGDIKYKDVNGDGVVDHKDKVAIGATSVPSLIYGIGFSVQWKGLDVNFHFQGAGKTSFIIWGPTVQPFVQESWGNIIKDVAANRWISREESGTAATERSNAKYPRLTYGTNVNNYQVSSYWLRDGRYLRLKTAEIGYTLPQKWTSKIRMERVRFYCTGTNLLTWSKFKMWDPEMNSSTGAVYPLAKTITLGLNINL